jgi:hypothetical protein
LENVLRANGSFPVKYVTTLNFSLVQSAMVFGENVTVVGYVTPEAAGLPVTVEFSCGNLTGEVTGFTFENGTFRVIFRPDGLGVWQVRAVFVEDLFRFGCESEVLTVSVEEASFFSKYMLYIGGGVGAGVGVAGVVLYWKKFRE